MCSSRCFQQSDPPRGAFGTWSDPPLPQEDAGYLQWGSNSSEESLSFANGRASPRPPSESSLPRKSGKKKKKRSSKQAWDEDGFAELAEAFSSSKSWSFERDSCQEPKADPEPGEWPTLEVSLAAVHAVRAKEARSRAPFPEWDALAGPWPEERAKGSVKGKYATLEEDGFPPGSPPDCAGGGQYATLEEDDFPPSSSVVLPPASAPDLRLSSDDWLRHK